MRLTLSRKYTTPAYIILTLFILLFIFSCKKNIDSNFDSNAGTPPDLITKVTSSVSGFVTDQNNAAVTGAVVKVGTINTTTDRYGYFEIKNIQVVKEAATVEVNYTGYFKAIKTYMATEGKAAFFRIKLLQKTIAGTVNATSGGNVSLSNGLNISLPANGIKNVSNGTIYNGFVNVAAQFIDPTSDEVNDIMPGDLRGIDADENIKGLTSYGMMAVELTGASGELLQVADGKKAVITFPVPASSSGAFNFSTLLCNNALNAIFIATDGTGLNQSSPISEMIIPGTNTLANIQACGVVSAANFFTYNINGVTAITYTAPADTIYFNNLFNAAASFIRAAPSSSFPWDEAGFPINVTNLSVGNVQDLYGFYCPQLINGQLTQPTPGSITITEYGPIGQFIAGNFACSLTSTTSPPIVYNVVGSFRARRNN